MGQFVIKLLLKTYLQVAGPFFKQNDLCRSLSVSMSEWLTSWSSLSMRLRQACGLPISALTRYFQAYLTSPPTQSHGIRRGAGQPAPRGLGGVPVWGSRPPGDGGWGAGLLSEARTTLWT